MKNFHKIGCLGAVILVAPMAQAKPLHQITDAQRENCLMTDNDDDGTEFCVKSGKGMSQAQLDEWYLQDAKKKEDARHKEAEARNEKIAAEQKQAEQKQIEAANEACLSNGDWKTCGDNSGVMKVAGQYGEVAVTCKEAANTQAKYGTPVWPLLPFQSHNGGKSALTTGKMSFIENDAQFQHMAHVMVTRDYDLNTQTAIVQIEEK